MTVADPVTPPPPPQPPSRGFDFARAFSFVFDDPEWLKKSLIGALFYLLSIFIVGIFFVFGYLAQLARNVIAGVERPLPDWDDLGGYFADGLRLFGVTLLYLIPHFLLLIVFTLANVFAGSTGIGEEVIPLLSGCFFLLLFPLFLLVYVVLPAALIRVAATGRFGAAFEFGAVWALIARNGANYALTIAIYLLASFVAQFGVLLFCVGIFFTGFLAMVVTTHALAQTYLYSPVK
jgi:hypothetical protein